MTGFTIIIAAKNLVGRAVDGAKNQLVGLGDTIKKYKKAIGGLSIALVAMGAGVRSLLKASTKTDELEAAFARVGSKWEEVKGRIGDGLADIFEYMARPIEAVLDALQTVIDKLQQVGAFAGALFANLGSGMGFREMLSTSWKQGGEVVDDLKMERAAREQEKAARAAAQAAAKEAEAKAKAAAAAKAKLQSDLAAARAKEREQINEAAYRKANDETKFKMLQFDRSWALQEYLAKVKEINDDASIPTDSKADRRELELLKYREKIRDLDEKIADLNSKMMAEQREAETEAANAAHKKTQEAIYAARYAEAEAKWTKRSASLNERIAKLKEGIAQDEATADAQGQAAEEHRERGMNYKAARAADKEAAREERRWQNRLNQAKRMENTRLSQELPGMRPWARLSKGFDKTEKLPGWAREVLASDKASKAAKAAEQAAATKRAELERAEAAKNKAVVEMEKDLKKIREDLEKALKPA